MFSSSRHLVICEIEQRAFTKTCICRWHHLIMSHTLNGVIDIMHEKKQFIQRTLHRSSRPLKLSLSGFDEQNNCIIYLHLLIWVEIDLYFIITTFMEAARKFITISKQAQEWNSYLTFHFMRIINPPQSHCLRKGKPAELLGLFDWWILWMMVTCNGWTISWIFMDEPTFFVK